MSHNNDEVRSTMAELLHKCLRCNESAYEVDKNIFRCSDNECKFEWEVIGESYK